MNNVGKYNKKNERKQYYSRSFKLRSVKRYICLGYPIQELAMPSMKNWINPSKSIYSLLSLVS